ncbi:hypothetical protein BDV97DRAFT_346503 [Delphinella strobiligena]|nr:hypothetical protein BDV97DRAFT_346503 [Delphinella strobiligena]
MGPSLTETAPLGRISSLMNQPSPHPIIPGLSIQPQPVCIPGLSYSIPGLSYQKPPTPQSQIRDPPPVRHVVSGTPVTTHAVPEASTIITTRPEAQHEADYNQSGRSQEVTTPHGQASAGPASESRPAKDFWSSLARGAQENGTSKIRVGPKGGSQHSMGDSETDQVSGTQTMSGDNGSAPPLDTRPLDNHPLDNRPLDSHSFGRPPDNHPLGRSLDRLEELLQGPPPERPQERRQDRPSDRPLEASQDRASSKPPSTPSTIALEPLSQRLRSTSDSFGSFPDRDNAEAFKSKKKAPKTSLYGPWPRSRNYDPFKHDRRTSTTSVGSQDGSRQYGNYGTPDDRHYQQPPPFPASAPPHGSYPPPPPQYAPVPPPPYGHDPRATPYQQSPYQQSPYQQSPYGGPPTGFSSLPGPPPMTQPPPPSPYYGVPPPPFSQPQTPYAHHPPPLAARPPTSQAYGPQYGGQPILPANPGPGGYGQNGASHGYPAAGHAGPAFAQYSQRDDGRRHDYGRGRGRHSGGHQEWKHYQGPR